MVGNGTFELNDFNFINLGHYVHQHLENAGSKEMAINGAAGKQFTYTVPTNWNLLLTGIHGFMYDATPGVMDAEEFGSATALTNGCQVYVKNPSDAVVRDFLDGEKIKVNADWAMLCGTEIHPMGAASNGYSFTWDILRQASCPVRLREGYKFIVKIQDDLSSTATSFQTVLTGIIVPEPYGLN